MRKIILVGAGTISKVYTDVLATAEPELHYVDPKFANGPSQDRCYVSIADIPQPVVDATDYWIICSPTQYHEESLRALLGRSPSARVLMEKPIVPLSQFARLDALVKQYPKARILENCQYEQSSLADRILAAAPEVTARRAELRGVYVEFTKNRIQDNRRGRFKDPEYLLVGYEGPHMLAVADSFVSRLYGKSLLEAKIELTCIDKNVPDPAQADEGSARFAVAAEGFPPIELYTSMIGEVGEDVLMPKRYEEVRRKWIFLRDRDRYRIVRFDFVDFSIVVRFDPQKILSDNLLRNEQLIYKARGREITKVASLNLNIFADAILGNLRRLGEPDYDTPQELRKARVRAELLDRLATLYSGAHERATSLDERRQKWRVEISMFVRVELEGGETASGMVIDVNEGGFQFEGNQSLPMGAKIHFFVEAEGASLKLRGRGTIRWGRHFTFEDEGLFCYGIAVTEWEGTTGRDVVNRLILETES